MQHTFGFISGLSVTQGGLQGQFFDLMPWERRFLRGALADGVDRAGLSIARGAGKSTFVAAIATAALSGPLAVRRGECVVVASSFQQGRVVFDHVLSFIAPWREADKRRYRVQDSANRAFVEDTYTGATLRCIGSDPARAHGLAPILAICDEPAQWPSSTSDRMRAAIETGLGKQPGSRLIALGTKPASVGHWFSRLLEDKGAYSQTHAARESDNPFHKRTWEKANPSLRFFPDLLAAYRREAERARRDTNLLSAFKALRLNLGTLDVERAQLLDAGLWESIEGEVPADGPTAWGCDLGTTAAMSAIVCYWMDTGRLEALAAFPAEGDLGERGRADGVGRLYQDMYNRGELILTGGHAVDVSELLREALSRWGRPSLVAADRWREGELLDALALAGVAASAFDARGQGFRDGAADVRLFVRECLDGRVRPVKSLLMRAAMAEAVTTSDAAGNTKLSKLTENGRRKRARDDAAAAAILAVSAGARQTARPQPVFRYHGLVPA